MLHSIYMCSIHRSFISIEVVVGYQVGVRHGYEEKEERGYPEGYETDRKSRCDEGDIGDTYSENSYRCCRCDEVVEEL